MYEYSVSDSLKNESCIEFISQDNEAFTVRLQKLSIIFMLLKKELSV